MQDDEMIKELWSLANIIAGFSIAQSLAFAFVLGRDLVGLQSQTMRVKVVLTIFCVVFAALYSFGVFWCYHLAMSVVQAHDLIWFQVTCGRVAGIWLFGAVPVFGLFAPNIFGQHG
jgi:hypothetical protein